MNNLGGALRFILIALSGVLLFNWFSSKDKTTSTQPIEDPTWSVPSQRAPYEFCELKTAEFRAELTTRGATLRHFELTTPKYTKGGEAHDVSTTPQPGAAPGTPQELDPQTAGDHEFRQQLLVQFRNLTSAGASEEQSWNLQYDSVDWELAERTATKCVFTYKDSDASLKKVVETTGRPYELKDSTTLTNESEAPKVHAAAVDTVAWWLEEDVESKMFRVSPYVTTVECVQHNGDAVRKRPEDFEPGDFEDPEFGETGKFGWYQAGGSPELVAVSNAYFSHALVPLDADKQPRCQLQVEQRGVGTASPGAYYRARLAYPLRNLGPGESATYNVLTYIGPKERRVLAAAGGGNHQLLELIDLGFFSAIAKVLVSFLLKVYSFIPNWGVAIILLTICAKILLFPLSIPGIRTMIKMRELKPEMDALTEKYGDDMRAKGVAQMELWRKHGMSPFDQVKGCLPQLATMPVWFALYSTLQTAVELYNIPFLWFPDLSEPDPYFVLPLIIGAVYFLQQKIAPFQGGDPAQRKMMMYLMPGMFTVFMLLLPAGLGVYMFTNSLLAIVQQQVVEAQAKKRQKGDLVVNVSDEASKKAASSRAKLGKGKPSKTKSRA